MKIRVISEFYDKFHTSTLFKVGTVLDFDDDRANDIISKKLAEPYSEPEKNLEPKPEVKAEQPEVKTEQVEKTEKPEPKKPGRPAKAKDDAKTEE
jgi:hypothetical protein